MFINQLQGESYQSPRVRTVMLNVKFNLLSASEGNINDGSEGEEDSF